MLQVVDSLEDGYSAESCQSGFQLGGAVVGVFLRNGKLSIRQDTRGAAT